MTVMKPLCSAKRVPTRSSYSAGDLPGLIDTLRAEAAGLRLRLVVCDSGSTDGTLAALSRERDVVVLDAGGNVGFAAGLNRARRHVGRARAVLVLNPDATLLPGAVGRMLEELDRPEVGIVVPRVVDEHGRTELTLHREPSFSRELAEAVIGGAWKRRPAFLAGTIRDQRVYEGRRPIQWASGAVLLIDAAAERQLGPWDERFFLYSEEVDYFRRAREAGFRAWYVPDAVVVHKGGSSGSGPALTALRVVNQVRYLEKWDRPRPWHRPMVALSSLRRVHQPGHRQALWFLLNRERWSDLPRAEAAGESADRVGDGRRVA